MHTMKGRVARVLAGALMLTALNVAGAQAAETISITAGADPTEEVPLPITANWSSGDPNPYPLVTVKPSGSQGCAVNYSADAANSETIISYESAPATGSRSTNQT